MQMSNSKEYDKTTVYIIFIIVFSAIFLSLFVKVIYNNNVISNSINIISLLIIIGVLIKDKAQNGYSSKPIIRDR